MANNNSTPTSVRPLSHEINQLRLLPARIQVSEHCKCFLVKNISQIIKIIVIKLQKQAIKNFPATVLHWYQLLLKRL